MKTHKFLSFLSVGLLIVLTIVLSSAAYGQAGISGRPVQTIQRPLTPAIDTTITVGTTAVALYTWDAADRRFIIQSIAIIPVRMAQDSADLPTNYLMILGASAVALDGTGGLYQDGFHNYMIHADTLWGYATATDSVHVTVWRSQ